MAQKHLFMSVILIVIVISRISGYRTCRGRVGDCLGDSRPNCLEKGGQPYFQCTPKQQRCEDAWLFTCSYPNRLTCHDGKTYCDCFCLLQQGIKQGPGEKPNLRRPRAG
uniref:Putative secreted peptide n=1 Tax=Rhipicephalus pulchellus TaxID=72859 RepID=L7M943_RHIPC